MNRSALKDLQIWHRRSNRKPLVLRGARQVGKSTLVRLFAQQSDFDLCEVNLEKFPQLQRVFESFDLKRIFNEIQAITQKRIHGGTLLFLDEIQAIPSALASLRYLYEEMPQLPVIAAGSLLDFALAEPAYSIPVGRIEYYHLGPLSFEEFLEAKHEYHLLSVLQSISLREKMTLTDHERCLNLIKNFAFVGGMPEVVQQWVKGAPPSEIQSLQRTLISTYQDDFNKYAKQKDVPLIREIFGRISAMIGRKVKYTELAKDEKSREIKKCLDLLVRAKIVDLVLHSDGSGIPLRAHCEPTVFKLIYLDVGLLNANLGVGWDDIHSLKNDELLTSGAQAEQLVGQTLIHLRHDSDPELFYWQREGKSQMAEVDYLFQLGKKIIPVEVKAGSSGKLRSLHQFIAARNSRFALKFDSQLPSVSQIRHLAKTRNGSEAVTFELMTLPIYLAGQSERILSEYFGKTNLAS